MKFFEALQLDLYAYLILGGLAVIVLAILLYLLPVSRAKVPAILASSLGALVLGAGLGIAAMVGFGFHWERQPALASANSGGEGGGGGGMGMMKGGGDMKKNAMMAKGGGAKKGGGGMKGGGGGGMMGGMMGGGGGGRPPSSKSQLANLVAKLDLLTRKAPAVDLTKEQKAKVTEQLKGLDEQKELSDEEAKKRLDTLLDVLKDHKTTFEEAGYRWPGQPGGPPPTADAPNPFQDKNTAQHLKSLRGHL
jgi:hypothetical protein